MSKHVSDADFSRGNNTMNTVYGVALLPPNAHAGMSPFADETVGHLFADIWTRPGLSVRDRRLLVIGATAMLGRADLIETQIFGALANSELSKAELDEILLQLAFYVGWGNATAVQNGFTAALARHKKA